MDSTPIIGRINTLPNEALVMILKKIKLKKRLPLRVLCARMKELIENISAGQTSLIITINKPNIRDQKLYLIKRFSDILILEQDHFLTHPNVEEGLLVIEPAHFKTYFADFITRLFPNMKQLIFDRYV